MMWHRRLMLSVSGLIVIASLAVGAVPAAARTADQASNLHVLATGLNNPRGLAFTASGKDLLVAETGKGGNGPCFEGPEGNACLGTSGAIALVRLSDGSVERVVTGLPSLALTNPPGFNAVGVHDIAAIDEDQFYAVMGLGGTPAVRAGMGSGAALLGHIVRVRRGSSPQSLVDLAAFEVANDVDGAGPDSNPYAIALRSDRLFIADAGANTLTAVDHDGKAQVATMFPDRLVPAPPFIDPPPPGGQIPMQAVPNSAAVGPDGAIYVGLLTGFPFLAGGANVYRIGANGQAEVYANGFTNIIDIDFDEQGNLYVLEIAKDSLLAAVNGPPTGRLVRVDHGSKAQTVIAADGLVAPTSVLVGAKAIYISNYGVFPDQGQIVKIDR